MRAASSPPQSQGTAQSRVHARAPRLPADLGQESGQEDPQALLLWPVGDMESVHKSCEAPAFEPAMYLLSCGTSELEHGDECEMFLIINRCRRKHQFSITIYSPSLVALFLTSCT